VDKPKEIKQIKIKKGFLLKNLMTGFSHQPLGFSDSKLKTVDAAHGQCQMPQQLQLEHNYPLYVGKHNYSARTTDDLSFNKGDLLHIIRADDDGWWFARCKDSTKEGYVPSSYVIEFKSSLSAEE